MGVVYVVASGKGGTGKTTLTANLGAALALCSNRVVVIDGDIGLRNLDMALGLETRVLYDTLDVLQQRCTLDAALLRHSHLQTLYLLPAPQNRLVQDIPDGGIKHVADTLKNHFDFVLIDAPAGVGRGFGLCREAADGLIAVTLPEPTALRDCDRLLRLASGGVGQRLFVALNRLSRRSPLNAEQAAGTLEMTLSAVIPEDPAMARLVDGMPAVMRRRSPAGRVIRRLAQEIMAVK